MFKIKKDKRGKWRWQLEATNGRILGASSQGFSSKDACRRNAIRLGEDLTGAVYRDATGKS